MNSFVIPDYYVVFWGLVIPKIHRMIIDLFVRIITSFGKQQNRLSVWVFEGSTRLQSKLDNNNKNYQSKPKVSNWSFQLGSLSSLVPIPIWPWNAIFLIWKEVKYVRVGITLGTRLLANNDFIQVRIG